MTLVMTSPGKTAAISFRPAIVALSLFAGVSLAVACGPAQALPGETLAQVKSRGTLRCGVSEGIAGFSIQDKQGNWSGLDVDFCRALAAVVLGGANKVAFVPLRASQRFPALRGGQIDLLARNTTWTMLREAALKVQFAGVLFYDGQGFMVPAKSRIKTLAALKGATVCVEKGTTSVQNLAEYSVERGLDVKPLVVDSVAEVENAFFSGKCGALTSGASQLAAVRLRAPGGVQTMVILPERISKEPLGPAVRAGDDDWLTLVRWVLYVMISAEEQDITRDNVRKRMSEPGIQRAFGAGDEFSKMLGIEAGWGLRLLQSAGNYGEMFERNLGRASALKLERGHNRLWTQGGLMYAPPLR
jgi:general L-amino acid transport system substrate-binding protein